MLALMSLLLNEKINSSPCACIAANTVLWGGRIRATGPGIGIKLMMIIVNLGVSMQNHKFDVASLLSARLKLKCNDIHYLCSAENVNCIHSHKVWWAAKLLSSAHPNYKLLITILNGNKNKCNARAARLHRSEGTEVGALLKFEAQVRWRSFLFSSSFLLRTEDEHIYEFCCNISIVTRR